MNVMASGMAYPGANAPRLAASAVARAAVLRLEERRQQTVHVQHTGARYTHATILQGRVAVLGQPRETVGKLLQDVDAEFALEVAGVEPPGFQLEDHLANQELPRRYRQGP